MATAKETIEAALRGEGCLGKAQPDEPVFVLRAQDRLAPLLIEDWADNLELHWEDKEAPNGVSEKIAAARRLAAAMREWGAAHGRKFPD